MLHLFSNIGSCLWRNVFFALKLTESDLFLTLLAMTAKV